MQCACAISSSVACPTLHYFSILSHKQHDFRKMQLTESKICVLISLQLLSSIFLFLIRNERDLIEMYIGLHVKCPLFLSDFNET
jgi:hypothetical protein